MSRIAIVEDENIVAQDLKEILEENGYEVTGIFNKGEELLTWMNTGENTDLVCMDIMLKGEMDGIKAAEVINSDYGIPVLFITAYTDKSTITRAKLSMPYGYIIKPFDKRELLTMIEIALYKHQMEIKLKNNQKWLTTILNSIGDAMIVTDEKGFIKMLNHKAESLLGWNEDELMGKKIFDFFCAIEEQKQVRFGENSIECDNKQVNLQNNILLNTKTGIKIPIYENATPIKDHKGKISGIVMTFHEKCN